MIEINLLPGSARRTRRSAPRRAASTKLQLKLPPFDRALVMLVGAWIIALTVVAYLHFSSTGELAELRVQEEAAVRDSTRYALLRSQGDSLAAQEALIAQKMQIIQDIDAARYVWPHILDEVSRALPQYIWLINMTNAPSDGVLPRVRIEGRAGNYYALGKYIEDLEASPFLHAVRLISSTRTIVDDRAVLSFYLELGYEEPAPDFLQTVPLFAAQQEN